VKDQIKQALDNLNYVPEGETRELDDADKVVLENYFEWLRWQNERIEQLEKALENLSTDGIAVEEATHEELCEFIASMKKRINQALGKENEE
jgi:glutamyl/glutaminyl-tRNA synthetase